MAAGIGDDQTPAQAVVKTIRAMGGEAVVDISDMSDWKGSKAMMDKAVWSFGGLDIRVEQRRHPAQAHVDQYDRGRLGLGHQGASQGNICAHAPCRQLLVSSKPRRAIR